MASPTPADENTMLPQNFRHQSLSHVAINPRKMNSKTVRVLSKKYHKRFANIRSEVVKATIHEL
jgi:hypothetical protein